MKHAALVVASILLMSTAALAQTYSNANLNGKYSLQNGRTQNDMWSKTFACPTNPTITFTANGSQTTWQGEYGSVTFDGKGNFSFSVTNVGKFNQAASANTMSVQWNSSCQVVSVNNGSIVYLAPTTLTGTGTYSVQSNGTGTLSSATVSPTTLLLAATDSAGISNTVFLTNVQTNGKSIGSGIAVHQ